ncbi:MAG: ArnT family glycosyltransferase [Hylemonella sp.]
MIRQDPYSSNFQLQRWLWFVALSSLGLRLWISHALPITGDEAFFYWWGVYPDWGYYDHPPMVGWLIAAMRFLLGDATWAIRFPVVVLPLIVGGLLWWSIKPKQPDLAAWGLLFFWLAPINWVNVLITTDTPLIFWTALSVALLIRADQRERWDGRTAWLYGLSGMALGCAFLSKYFAVVLALAYGAYFVVYRRDRWAGLLILLLCALPGPMINAAWNMSHGWPNIMFNAINRNQEAAFEWFKPWLYLGMLAYLLTPALIWLGLRYRHHGSMVFRQQRLLGVLLLLPLLFFALLSFKKVVGLHWVLAFYPWVFLWFALLLPPPSWKSCAQGLAAFTALHLALIAGVSFTQLEQWEGQPRYYSMVRAFRTAELLKQVTSPQSVLMADGYAPAAAFGHTLGHYVPVFGPGKFHARQDDLLVDFSSYQGKTIRILVSDSDPPDLSHYQAYFDTVKALSFIQSGVTFHAVEGQNFNYEAYRREVLGDIFQRFYAIPEWLPMTGCPFCVRYCGMVRCPR